MSYNNHKTKAEQEVLWAFADAAGSPQNFKAIIIVKNEQSYMSSST